MGPRRIAYVVNVFPKVSESFIANEIAELRRRGVEVMILSRRRPDEEIRHPVVQQAGLERLALYEPRCFGSALYRFGPELIHAHFATEATGLARALAREHGVPYTFTAHSYDIYDRPPADFAARATGAAAVVTVSEANARYMVDRLGAPQERIRVIPCGIDVEQFRPGPERADGVPRLLGVARLHPVKNLALLFEACRRLMERGVAFRCQVAGDGKARDEIQALHARMGLGDHVELLGACDQETIRALWGQADLGVLCSDSEGMPVSLMEAAACGVPVVATAVGGVPEQVLHERTGLVVPPRDPEALADALARLLTDHGQARAMGEQARIHACETFSVQRQVDELQGLWASMLEPVEAVAS